VVWEFRRLITEVWRAEGDFICKTIIPKGNLQWTYSRIIWGMIFLIEGGESWSLIPDLFRVQGLGTCILMSPGDT
jgi:hypothetical protein